MRNEEWVDPGESSGLSWLRPGVPRPVAGQPARWNDTSPVLDDAFADSVHWALRAAYYEWQILEDLRLALGPGSSVLPQRYEAG